LKKDEVERRIRECLKKFDRESKSLSELSDKEIQDFCDEYY
jgi:hypothetical protein